MTKTRFSVVLDSAFRLRDQYPRNTNFVVPINDSSRSDYVDTPVMIFAWSSPLYFLTGTIIGGSQSSLILSSSFVHPQPNYYRGCLASLYNGAVLLESSLITMYDSSKNTISLEVPFTNSIQTFNDIHIDYPNSTVNPYIIQALGYDPEYIFEYSKLYLYNFTKRWIREIRFINNNGLINLVEPIPLSHYSVNDTFQIRTSLQILQFPLTTFYESIVNYRLEPGLHDYKIGSYVHVKPDILSGTDQIYQVKQKSTEDVLTLELIEFGGPFGAVQYYPLYDSTDPLAPVETLIQMQVLQTRTVLDGGDNPIPSPENNVLYLGSHLIEEFFYYSYVVDRNYIILIDQTDPYDLLVQMEDLPVDERQYGFLSKTTVQCTMNVANFTIPENQICTSVQLEYLILPNQRVKGYNKLLSFFPYVVVKLYNTDAPQYSRFGTITSNNTTSSNCQFICPIGNLLNPLIIKFVEVTSDMVQTLKISPYQDLYFEVLLPDGTPLEYEDLSISVVKRLADYNFSIRDTVACIFTFTTTT